MDTIALELIIAKVGDKDVDKIPQFIEITAEDLMIYIVTIEWSQ